ncbi:MAG TPA: adenylosuccinate synthase [Aquifex aeolicus]|nr:adenylosuccinate synthase [Aquifex aeolicus]
MEKLVILGAQWGDEGKGKIVDLLSEHFEVTVRYQGGSNAGHTVVINEEKFILHLLPTGILHEHVIGVIAQGMVVDLEVLEQEIKSLEEKGIHIKERLVISDRVHLVMPYHKLLDSLFEKKKGIGTTLRGIGPAYMFKYGRKGIRISDLYDEKRFYGLLEENLDFVKSVCEKVFCEKFELDLNSIYERQLSIFEKIKSNVKDVFRFFTEENKSILFEGAQGTLLDIDMGTYPFVTSSNSSTLGLSNGTGLSPKYFSDAYFLGVAKAYVTRVGDGPFPTELKGKEGEKLRELGGEYGSTTGRPRRCGWLDLVALKYAVEVNGLSGLVLTKLDVLDVFEEVKVCVAYELDGKVIDYFPASYSQLSRVKPVYETLKGWNKSTKGVKDINELPKEAIDYIRFIEDYIGVPVVMLSTGPKREEYIWLKEILKTKSSYS